eukprot:363984-Chlamydomonas_euryale.AAC.6
MPIVAPSYGNHIPALACGGLSACVTLSAVWRPSCDEQPCRMMLACASWICMVTKSGDPPGGCALPLLHCLGHLPSVAQA